MIDSHNWLTSVWSNMSSPKLIGATNIDDEKNDSFDDQSCCALLANALKYDSNIGNFTQNFFNHESNQIKIEFQNAKTMKMIFRSINTFSIEMENKCQCALSQSHIELTHCSEFSLI